MRGYRGHQHHFPFFHHVIQEDIENLARRLGIPLKYVSPAYTSTACPVCGRQLQQGVIKKTAVSNQKRNRSTCCKCGFHADRDAVACYNIGKRALKISVLPHTITLRFRKISWSALPARLAAVSITKLMPVQDYVLASHSSSSFQEWDKQSGGNPLLANKTFQQKSFIRRCGK